MHNQGRVGITICGRPYTNEGPDFGTLMLGRADDMVVIRGVNIYPSAVEDLVRRCESVEEFRIQVFRVREMANLEIEIELRPDADSETSKEKVFTKTMITISVFFLCIGKGGG